MKKILKISKYFLFPIVMFCTFYWVTILLFFSSLHSEKLPVSIIQDNELQSLIKEETGVEIKEIKISETPKLFAVMIGIPTQPQLILSRGLYDSFSDSAKEYVVLHEIGHYVLFQGVIEWGIGILFIIIGILILRKIKPAKYFILVSIFLGLFLGIILIQVGKINEIKADKYAVSKISNPQGMIEATNNFRNYQGTKYSESTNVFLELLFYRGNPYENRIKMAKDEIHSRKNPSIDHQ